MGDCSRRAEGLAFYADAAGEFLEFVDLDPGGRLAEVFVDDEQQAAVVGCEYGAVADVVLKDGSRFVPPGDHRT